MKTKKQIVGVRMDDISTAILDELVEDVQNILNEREGSTPSTVTRSAALRLVLLSLGRADKGVVGVRRSEFRKFVRKWASWPLFGV